MAFHFSTLRLNIWKGEMDRVAGMLRGEVSWKPPVIGLDLPALSNNRLHKSCTLQLGIHEQNIISFG
jgi:hypothetical protein